MTGFIKSKNQLATTILFSLIITFGIIVSFSYIDNIILHYVELFFHKTLRDPARWIDIIQNTSALVIFSLCVIYFFCYINYGIKIKSGIKTLLQDYKKKYATKNNLILFLLIIVFLFLSYFSIISANFYYADDLFRNYGGNRSWIGFSRYISEFGSIFIHNSLKLNDIAPLTQFIAIAIASITIIILSISLTDSLKIKSLIATSIIFIAPYYAENISYRFDAPYMAISLFFAAVPFLFKTNTKAYISVSILSLILTCISYQAALPLYILTVIYLFIKQFIKRENLLTSIKFVFQSVISFIIALVIFKLFFMNKMKVEDDSYFSSTIRITSFFKNCTTYLRMALSLNGGLLTKVLFLLSIVMLLLNVTICTKQNKLLSLTLVITAILVSAILSFGPYLVFEHPVFAPRAFMGFNVFMSFIVLGLSDFATEYKSLEFTNKIINYIFVYSCIVFLFAYGNTLKKQNEYENFRISMILNDISEYTTKSETYNISFIGNIDLCEKNRIALKNYPLLKNIVPTRLSENSIWNEEYLNGYNFKCTTEKKNLTSNFILAKQTYYHDIYQYNNNFIIVLK